MVERAVPARLLFTILKVNALGISRRQGYVGQGARSTFLFA